MIPFNKELDIDVKEEIIRVLLELKLMLEKSEQIFDATSNETDKRFPLGKSCAYWHAIDIIQKAFSIKLHSHSSKKYKNFIKSHIEKISRN